jgi:predicted regulator of Ras-like GTPase activity (Roadblock/LC7/MglB family)
VPVNDGGILEVLAKDEMRLKQVFVELRKSAWLMPPGPLGSS